MVLQHYVLANLGWFFSYWSGRPAVAFSVIATIFFLEIGIFEYNSGTTGSEKREFTLYRLFSLIFGVIIGGGLSLVLDKPEYPMTDITERLSYHLKCLVFALLWIASLLAWQFAPQHWWNYAFVGLLFQLILIIASYFFINHNKAWNTPDGNNDSVIVHWQFLIINILFLNLPFVIGQSAVSGLWPFYLSIAFFGASTIYAVLLNSCHQVRVANYISVLVTEPSPSVERL